MNFPEKSISNPIRSFVSEKDIEERKQRRQEEWEKTRKPEDPLEAPEEEIEHRTLFDRLQEQKNKKQEEYEESHKLKNMIRGLDNDEVTFLEYVDKKKMEEDDERYREEQQALNEYKTALADLSSEEQEKKLTEYKKSLWSTANSSKSEKSSSAKKSQASLLQNAVKRKAKPSESESKEPQAKKVNSLNLVKVLGVLPGIGCYSDSEESEKSENENIEDFLLIPRAVRKTESACSKQ
ncbi:hypothetical protein HDE_00143 [Halotydeus destructor]|nr:hypothetical protein HDE_00143 [Halotydeus destructor]